MVQLGNEIVQPGYEIVDCTSRGDTALLFSLWGACFDVWPSAVLADVRNPEAESVFSSACST